jgi:hypothetical protein
MYLELSNVARRERGSALVDRRVCICTRIVGCYHSNAENFSEEDRAADLRTRRDLEVTGSIERQHTTSQRIIISSNLAWKNILHIRLIHLGLRTLSRYEVSPQYRVEVWIIAEVGFL